MDAFQDHYPENVSHCYGCGHLNEHGHQIKTVWDDRALRTERHSTQYGRSFELPQAVQEDAAKAAFENGVLALTLPKREARQGRRLQVS